MKTALFLAAALLVGCGQGPLCQDSTKEAAFINGCTRGGSSYGYCGCAFDYLADRYACEDMGNVTYNVIQEGCRACGGGC